MVGSSRSSKFWGFGPYIPTPKTSVTPSRRKWTLKLGTIERLVRCLMRTTYLSSPAGHSLKKKRKKVRCLLPLFVPLLIPSAMNEKSLVSSLLVSVEPAIRSLRMVLGMIPATGITVLAEVASKRLAPRGTETLLS